MSHFAFYIEAGDKHRLFDALIIDGGEGYDGKYAMNKKRLRTHSFIKPIFVLLVMEVDNMAGKAVSVYLNERAIVFLEDEIAHGQKSSRGLTVARLVAMCVDYVIDKGELKYVSSYVNG